MTHLVYITHPDVIQDPAVPVPEWPLSPRGRARMATFLTQSWAPRITAVYSSTERKSLDGAAILAGHLCLPSTAVAELGEVDRSSTGFMSQDEHATAARALMEFPETSVLGWETACHAQQRMLAAVYKLLPAHGANDAVALIGHGGVGTLLLCHLAGRPIALSERPPGVNGGYYFVFDTVQGELVQAWTRIDNPPVPHA